MSRYNENFERNAMSVFTQVTLGIIAAAVILGTIAGIIVYLKSEAEITQLRILAQMVTSNTRKPITINVPKSRDQLVYERSTKAYEDAVRQTAEFKQFYQRPEVCNFQKDEKVRVFCANHFMRAKKAWESLKTAN